MMKSRHWTGCVCRHLRSWIPVVNPEYDTSTIPCRSHGSNETIVVIVVRIFDAQSTKVQCRHVNITMNWFD